MAKSTALDALILLGVSNKWSSSPMPCYFGYLIHSHPVPHPLPWSTLVPMVSWIRNVLWPIIRRPLSRVPERHEARAPCVHKRVDTELVRYPSLDIIVAMPSCCHQMWTYKVVLPWFTTSALEILEDNHMYPRLSDLAIGRCTAPMLDLISPCGVVKACNLMCASPFSCLL